MDNKLANFKECSCGQTWKTRHDYLSDPKVIIHGYMVHFKELTLGLFIFLHIAQGCETSLAIKAGEFSDLYEGVIFKDRLTGTDNCQGYCLQNLNLAACPQECECAWVRDVIQILKKWPKRKIGT